MIIRKYIVHISGTIFIGALIIYSNTCDPLPFSEILLLSQSITQDPACIVQTFSLELPELQQNVNSLPLNNSAIHGTAVSNASAALTDQSVSYKFPKQV